MLSVFQSDVPQVEMGEHAGGSPVACSHDGFQRMMGRVELVGSTLRSNFMCCPMEVRRFLGIHSLKVPYVLVLKEGARLRVSLYYGLFDPRRHSIGSNVSDLSVCRVDW